MHPYSVLAASLASVAAVAICVPVSAQTVGAADFALPAQPLAASLTTIAQKTGVNILFRPETVDGIQAPALIGRFSARTAVDKLLAGSALEAQPDGNNGIVVRPVQGSDDDARATSDIIVTATRRAERLVDVAGAVTAVSAAAIEQRGLVRFQDFLVTAPGVAFQDRGPGRNKVVIRGVSGTTAPSEVPTVATFFGEVPISVFGTTQNGTPDIKLFDLQRVEILRGPQGTLFGAGSMGGALRIIPEAPQLGEVSGHAMATIQSVEYGDIGYNLGIALNLPVSDKLAFRLVGYRYDTPGFIDNVANGDSDINFNARVPSLGASWAEIGVSTLGVPVNQEQNLNGEITDGVRVSAYLEATERLNFTLSGFYQSTSVGGLNDISPALGTYKQRRAHKESLSDKIGLLNLLINYGGDGFDVLSSTGYLHRETVQDRDLLGPLAIPIYLRDEMEGDFVVQEFRISSSGDRRFDWLAGAYYSYQDRSWRNFANWYADPAAGEATFDYLGFPDGAIWADTQYPLTEEQVAVFGEVSYKLTDRLKVTAGGRWFQYDQRYTQISEDYTFFFRAPFDQTGRLKEDSFAPNFVVDFKPTEDTLLYGRAAKGFRVGTAGVVPLIPESCRADLEALGITSLPPGSSSDSVWSYEAGAKGSFMGGRIKASAAAFYIDWENIQTSLTLACGISFRANAGKARSRGVELEFDVAVDDHLDVQFSGSYVDAVLKEDTPTVTGLGGLKGDRLPGIPQITMRVGLNYQRPISETYRFNSNVDLQYVGEHYVSFRTYQTGTRPGGDYMLVNARAGIGNDRWDFELFANNLFNRDVILLWDPQYNDGRLTAGRPRTIGATVRTRF